MNLKILSTKNYNSINNFFAYKCYELLLSKGINILSLKMLTILIYIYVHSLCQIWHVFAIISSKISCPFLSLLLGIALWICCFFWSIPLFSETLFLFFFISVPRTVYSQLTYPKVHCFLFFFCKLKSAIHTL